MERIYIGNISFTTTEDGLCEAFSTFGTVESVRLVTDKVTGTSKGFAFIEMPEADCAAEAIKKLNGTMLDGRKIRVNLARERR